MIIRAAPGCGSNFENLLQLNLNLNQYHERIIKNYMEANTNARKLSAEK